MSQTIKYLGSAVDPGILLRGLKDEGMLPDYLEDTAALTAISAQLRWYQLDDEAGPFAIVAQMVGPQPKTATIWLFIQRKGATKDLKPEFREFGQVLWNLWFKHMGLERVQAYIPLSKLKHLKLLTSWRFQEETRMGGCRKGIRIADKWQDLAILGLVSSDLPAWWHKARQEATEEV